MAPPVTVVFGIATHTFDDAVDTGVLQHVPTVVNRDSQGGPIERV